MSRPVSLEVAESVETTRYPHLPAAAKVLFVCFSGFGIGVALFYLLGLSVKGLVLLDVGYFYLLMAIFCPCSFLILPRFKHDRKVPWYDFGLAGLSFGIALYFFLNAYEICQVGWCPSSSFNFALAMVFVLLILEGGRRTGGYPYVIICFIAAVYGLIADRMPGILYGFARSTNETISLYVYGGEGIIGIPSAVIGNILIGFLLFAGVLIASGAQKFLLDFAYAIAGRFRGGPAKVAVLASAFMGMLSGSAPANVVTTGSVTIPAMKRLGYSPEYAGAIEACASIGGTITPPVMGAVIFVMCVMIGETYAAVMVAAAIPAILYYFGLMVQVDEHAAKVGLKGLLPHETPSLKKALKDGWRIIVVLLFLVWGLLYMRWAALAPIYASGLMFLLSFTNRKTMMTPKKIVQAVITVGKLVAYTVALLLPLGVIIAPLCTTGVTASLSAALLFLCGGKTILLLVTGAMICFVLGLVGMLTPAYVFLAVTLAPALMKAGDFDIVSTHLFIVYTAMLSGLTPPVAVIAFIGAGIAGAPAMKTAFRAMQLGIVLYIIPFFFVLEPSLVLKGPIQHTIWFFTMCLLGIVFLASGLEGYLWKVGKLGVLTRIFIVPAGFLVAIPKLKTTIIGISVILVVLAVEALIKRMKASGGYYPRHQHKDVFF